MLAFLTPLNSLSLESGSSASVRQRDIYKAKLSLASLQMQWLSDNLTTQMPTTQQQGLDLIDLRLTWREMNNLNFEDFWRHS